MNNQNGSAIVIVMMLLTILTLVGVGMLIQTRIDTKYTKSKVSYDRTVNVADGAARIALYAIKTRTVDTMKFSGHSERQFISEADSIGTKSRGYWESYRILTGYDKRSPPGWPLGDQEKWASIYWVAEGGGAQARNWSSSQSYAANDLVAHKGSTYKRKSPGGSAGSEPGVGSGWSNYWEPVSPNQTVVDVSLLRVTKE